ncbi:MAG: hypothetical protein WCH43_16165 [Verrucomicrobiota bacterium]
MKKNLILLAALLLLALGGSIAYYHFATAGMASMLCKTDGEMDWLRQEFKLTDAQFEKISALHAAYRPKCDRMCEKVAAARARLDHLIDTNRSVTPEVESAFKEFASVEEECRQAMLGHIYEVSELMPPENSARYVHLMKEHLLLEASPAHPAMHDAHSH